MNILLLTDAFLPHMGGSRVYYYNLYKSLLEQYGDRVTILTKKVPGWQPFDERMQRHAVERSLAQAADERDQFD